MRRLGDVASRPQRARLAGWLAGILARTAAELGSTAALTAGRSGSWEAELVQRLLKGTVGYDDEHLDDYRDDRRPR